MHAVAVRDLRDGSLLVSGSLRGARPLGLWSQVRLRSLVRSWRSALARVAVDLGDGEFLALKSLGGFASEPEAPDRRKLGRP